MRRHVSTYVSDEAWQKECKRRLDEALDKPELAKKALDAIQKNPGLRRSIPGHLYFKVLAGALFV